jgi:hypothetical protein
MNVLRSIAAVVAGIIFIFITHSATDFILESLGIFTSPDQGFHTPWMVVTAFIYRTIFSVGGAYVTGRLAPSRPVLHAIVLGMIGLFLSTAAAILVIPMNLSPAWYPIALVAVAVPCGWLGGWIAERGRRDVA